MGEDGWRQGAVGIVGTGLMGTGIAALICAAGVPVKAYDVNKEQLAELEGRVRTIVEELEAHGLSEPNVAAELADRLEVINGFSGFSDCVAVIEAVVEDAAVKREVYSLIEKHVGPGVLIATNTSNIVPSDLVTGMNNPERFLVIHFWNPPHAVPLVEVVPHSGTSKEIIARAVSLVKRIGNEPVVLNKEAAGFVGNRLQYALLREALWIVQQGIAGPEEVDRVMTLSLGRRYAVTGPFATADLGGLDTFFAISNQLMPQLASDNSPLEMMERIVSAGNTGSKSGRGFLDWPDERIRVVIKARNNALLQRRREERREAKENLS